jgi:hypothetical protein
MLKHPTLSFEDEEGSRLELLVVSGQSNRGIPKGRLETMSSRKGREGEGRVQQEI